MVDFDLSSRFIGIQLALISVSPVCIFGDGRMRGENHWPPVGKLTILVNQDTHYRYLVQSG